MKKILMAFLMIGIVFIIAGCDVTKVDSITFTDKEGNEHIIDHSYEFFDLFDLILDNFSDSQLMIEIDSTIVLNNGIKEEVKGTLYRYDTNSSYYDFQAKWSNDSSAIIQEYNNEDSKENSQIRYAKYQSDSDLAFVGQEVSNGNITNYISDKFPSQPNPNSKLSDLSATYKRMKYSLSMIKLFEPLGAFRTLSGGEMKEYDFDSHAVRSYELYKNCIMFEQESPFPTPIIAPTVQKYVYYVNSLAKGYTFNQKMKYEHVTNTISYISYSGNAIFYYIDMENPIEMDITLRFKDFDNNKYENSFNELKSFIQKNAK